MKLGTIIFSMFFIFILLFSLVIYKEAINSNIYFFQKSVSQTTQDIIFLQGERIDYFLQEKQMDIIPISNSKESINIFKKEIVEDKNSLVKNIEKSSDKILKEIINYILINPYATLEDLKSDENFKKIAVQSTGGKGYSIIASLNGTEFNMNFHKYPEYVDKDMFNISYNFESTIKILKEAIESDESRGFYSHLEPSGEYKEKYGVVKKIPIKTADKEELYLINIGYLEDYLSAGEITLEERFSIDNYLEEFKLHNFFLISPNGNILYAYKGDNFKGMNSFWEIYSPFTQMNENNFSIKEEINFYGPFISFIKEDTMVFAESTKIYEEGVFLGYAVMVFEMEELNDILGSVVEQNLKTRESYLINSEKLLITHLKLIPESDLLVQKIDTLASEHCFNEKNEINFHADIGFYQNYHGEYVFGGHKRLENTNWCLITEVDSKEILDNPKQIQKTKNLIFLLTLFIVLSLISVIISVFLNKKYSLKKLKVKNKLFFKSKFSFLEKLTLSNLYLLLLFISLPYLFSLIFNIINLNNTNFSKEFFNLIIFNTGILIAFYGAKLKNNNLKFLISIGGILISIKKLIEVLLEKYLSEFLSIFSTNWFYQFFPTFLEFCAILLILFGIGGNKK